MKKLSYLKLTTSFLILCLTSVMALAQVTGVVTSSEDGEPLIGASVLKKGTVDGTVTDISGNYQISAAEGDVLIFSFVGFKTTEVAVGASATLNVSLETDATLLNEMVVSATRTPVRKLQATTAVNSISAQEIKNIQPESFTEALQTTPGVTVNNAQGRKGGFNIRGFPGGSVYTTTLIDGLPTSGTANLSAGTQEFYGIDPTVERVEIVRGAAATLFGRSSAAGAVNIISRTGGTEHSGAFSLTKYSNVSDPEHQYYGDANFRADWGFNGPLSDKLRYNVGGYVLNDSGAKEQAHKDVGAQIRGNIDWLISEGSRIRFSATYLQNDFQNVVDAPWDLGRNEVGAGFGSHNTFFNDSRQLNGDRFLASGGGADAGLNDTNGDPIIRNPADFGERTWGGNFGIDGTFDLGNGWSLNEKLRYQRFNWNDLNDITFNGFYDIGSNLFRFLGSSEQDTDDFISETRISKEIRGANSVHNISGGIYYSSGMRDRLGTNFFYFSNVSPRPTFTPLANVRASSTTSHREETTTGFFIGDEMVFGEKLSVNVAFRYDSFDAFFSTDPGEIRSTGTDFDPASVTEINESFSDYSGSIGFNYLVGENSAFYANYLRAFSLPSVTTRTFVRPEENEVVNNLELGFRAGLGDLTVDATVFNTKINNRVALALNATTREFEAVPAGSNKILGAEVALTYAPRAIKGLLIRTNVTLQNSEYDEFNIAAGSTDLTGDLFGLETQGEGEATVIKLDGNQVENAPKAIYNLNLGYGGERWGMDFGGFTYSNRYADATNLFKAPNLSAYNLGGYITFPIDGNEIKFSIRIKNVFDSANPQGLLLSTRDASALVERQANPVSPDGRFAFATIQNPRRVLLTIGYSF